MVATTNPFGAGKWREEYSECLAGMDVIVIPDSDRRGIGHADDVCSSLEGVARTIRRVTLPQEHEVKDLSDYLKSHSLSDIVQLTGIKEYVYAGA